LAKNALFGQERALGLIGRYGPLVGFGQLEGAMLDQLFQMVAVAVEFLAQPFFFGDVFLHRDVMRDGAIGLAQWSEVGEFDVFAAVLAPVDEFPFPRLAPRQGSPQCRERFQRRFQRRPAGLQDARAFAQHLLAAVAGDADERFVNVFDASVEVGDDDALWTLLHRHRELAQLRLGSASGGDVAGATPSTPTSRPSASNIGVLTVSSSSRWPSSA